MAFTFPLKKLLLFISIGFALVFTLVSTNIIIKVNATRQNVENLVADNNTLSKLEAETFSLIDDVDRIGYRELIDETKTLITFENLAAEVDFKALKNICNEPNKGGDKETLKNELILISKICQYTIGDNRKQLRANSEKLLNYWNYTHILLIIACTVFLILPVIFYKSFTKKNDCNK